MKTVFVSIVTVVTMSVMAAVHWSSDAIINALKQGDAEKLSTYFDTFIDIKLPEKEEIKNVSKNQASIAIKSFFETAAIKGFEVTSQRELGGTKYMTGKLIGNGKTYNITLMMKSKGDEVAIITIRIG
ncbi:MAG: DUF4783 domain-containing protein [Chitinophagaceae bacterium]